jgi:hypothetical protein
MSDAPKPTAVDPLIDARDLVVVYANYCRVSATPEEVILDFGLNSRVQTADGPEPVQLTHRLVLGWATTQRIAEALAGVVRVHHTHPSHRPRPTHPPESRDAAP